LLKTVKVRRAEMKPALVIPHTGNYQIVYWLQKEELQCASISDFCDGSREVAAGVETH